MSMEIDNIELSIADLAFVMNIDSTTASDIFKSIFLSTKGEAHARGKTLKVSEVEAASPGIKAVIKDIQENYLKRRDSASWVLNDKKSIETQKFSTKLKPLLKFLSKHDIDKVYQNWKIKKAQIQSQLSII